MKIDDLPIKDGDFPVRYGTNYQRVNPLFCGGYSPFKPGYVSQLTDSTGHHGHQYISIPPSFPGLKPLNPWRLKMTCGLNAIKLMRLISLRTELWILASPR